MQLVKHFEWNKAVPGINDCIKQGYEVKNMIVTGPTQTSVIVLFEAAK